MSLRIAIDASRSTVPWPTGTETYSRRLLQALVSANLARDIPHRLTLYFRDAPDRELFPADAMTRHCVIPLRRAWTHLRFANELWRTRPDMTFVPAHTLPFFFPGRAIATVHDLGFMRYPEAHPRKQRAYLRLTTAYSQRRATLVLADSQATADDLAQYCGAPAEKIRVIYPGVDVPPPRDAGSITALREKHRLPERYFLFIGTLQPRKNIAGIVRAFAEWQRQTGDAKTGLALAGAKGWLFDDDWIAGVKNVTWIGYVDEADKGALLSGALALVFPSFHEGFGFPAIEAMGCGTPVIASDSSSLRELVSGAGLLVDPRESSEISRAMGSLSADAGLRAALIERGKKRAAAFTWERAAEQLLEVIGEIEAMGAG